MGSLALLIPTRLYARQTLTVFVFRSRYGQNSVGGVDFAIGLFQTEAKKLDGSQLTNLCVVPWLQSDSLPDTSNFDLSISSRHRFEPPLVYRDES